PLSLTITPSVVECSGSDAAAELEIPLPFHNPPAQPVLMRLKRAVRSAALLPAVLWKIRSLSARFRPAVASMVSALVLMNRPPLARRLMRAVPLIDSEL